jgi:hypothetical protein
MRNAAASFRLGERRLSLLNASACCLPLGKVVHISCPNKSNLVRNQVKKEPFSDECNSACP